MEAGIGCCRQPPTLEWESVMEEIWHDSPDILAPANLLAVVHPAKQEDVDTVLNAPLNDDGRSEWQWFRLPNGDLILGVFPCGDTYFAVADKAGV